MNKYFKAHKHFCVNTSYIFLLCVLILSIPCYANDILNLQKEHNIQEQRIFEQLQEQQRLSNLPSTPLKNPTKLHLPRHENPCFVISNIKLDIPKDDLKTFLFLHKKLNKKSTGIKGACIGHEGLQEIVKFSQYLVVNKGFVTTKVLLKPQDLTTGVLVLSVITGKVSDIYRTNDDKFINLHNAMTVKSGDILNLRQLEQSINNLRLPQNTKATINIEPSLKNSQDAYVGLSDLVIETDKTNKVSTQWIVNNFGNQSTGNLQGGLGININEPLWSNDKLYLQYMHTLDNINQTKTPSSNQNTYISYYYPFKDWQLHFSYNHSRYTQSLKGFNHDPIYKGITQRKHIQISKLLHKGSHSSLTGYAGLNHKDSKYYIDDLQILVQHQKTSNHTIGLSYENIPKNNHRLNIDLSATKGIGAFGAKPIAERFYSDVDSRPLVWQMDVSYRMPFKMAEHNFGYHVRMTGQYSNDKLGSNEQFTVGDRHSVRGFKGGRYLAGNKGLIVGQEVYYKLPTHNPHQAYIAIDKGFVSTNGLKSNHYDNVVGTVLGYRFGTKHVNFDAYVGKPLKSNVLSDDTNFGMQLAFTY